MNLNRDVSIDSLRGVAIVTMVAANLAAMVLVEPHPLWFRVYGTFAAALFVILAGSMVSWTAWKKNYPFTYYVKRGGSIILVGALLDVFLWQIFPFTTVDVLYLIGLSLPICALVVKRSPWVLSVVVLLIFGFTPILQTWLGYSTYPSEFSLNGQPTQLVANQTAIWQHWLIDGWFPLFPWLGFALFGVLVAHWRWQMRFSIATKPHLVIGVAVVLVVVGMLQFYFYTGALYTRNGYSELFYPPTVAYITTAIGVLGVLLGVLDFSPRFLFQSFLEKLGRHSLSIYVLHLVLGELLFVKTGNYDLSLSYFMVGYVVMLVLLYFICFGIELAKKWMKKNILSKFGPGLET